MDEVRRWSGSGVKLVSVGDAYRGAVASEFLEITGKG
jgi:chromosome segregation and condensation protein ScpB